MRALAILAAALVATAALSGCIGGLKETDDPVDPARAGGDVPAAGGSGTPALTVLKPLASQITLDAADWIVSGTQVEASLAAPTNADGNVSYTWAIGPRPGTVEVQAFKADTGSKGADYIQPGASKAITYGAAGVYLMHCHPHPYMLHNVTVIEGFEGPKSVTVHIVDGEAPGEYRFVPENIVVGVNTSVTYKNVGAQPHSATAMGAQEPPLKVLPLKAGKGPITIEGEGWQRIVAVFKDDDGRLGIAEKNVYVTSELPTFKSETHEFTFTYGASQLQGTAAAAAAKSVAVSLKQPALVFINYTFTDALGASGASPAEVEVHFAKDGETQDTLTGEGATGALSGKAVAGAFTLKVVPVMGANLEGTVTVEAVYDLVPPEPTQPAAGAGDGHGGHAH